jgi:hypothetical protein
MQVKRGVPQTLADHPGNIFLATEDVSIQAPEGDEETWLAIDYDGKLIAKSTIMGGRVALGKLPVGWYEVLRHAGNGTNRVSVGVIEPLQAVTPQTSPVAIDVAMAWLYPGPQMEPAANLCALAGINRVRDRLNWAEIEPVRGQMTASNRYDSSIGTQARAGLKILNVDHISPAWANPVTKRFPLDLRDAYAFYRAAAKRWRGQVEAFEPWNEADIPMFGGHTGSEMASFQKAAYLGLKAGNPDVIACLNVLAIHRASTLADLHENAVWPYFDTYNLHHYEAFEKYPRLYADHRAVSAGRPLWVSECSLPVKGDPKTKEPSPADLRRQSERLAITYALSLYERATAVFFFMLPHYNEGDTQFGILRGDLTPRPAYLTLAAVGRLLADARPLGRVAAEKSVHGYLFDAKPNGQRKQVLVVWADQEQPYSLPAPASACYDHLGRLREIRGSQVVLTHAPLFLCFDHNRRFPTSPPPAIPQWLPGKPSEIVLQTLMPESSISLEESAYKVPARQRVTMPVYIYNFGKKPASGTLSLAAPNGLRASLDEHIRVLPGERKQLSLSLLATRTDLAQCTVRITGNFGSSGETVLSFKVVLMYAARSGA